MRISTTFKNLIVLIGFLVGPINTYAQENLPTPGQLKKPITELLLEYQQLTASLTTENQSQMMGSIIRLFHNPMVQVIDDIDPVSATGFLPIEDYLQKLILRLPEGHGFSIHTSEIRVSKPQFDTFYERYLVDVWVIVDQPGQSGNKGQVNSRIFTLGFYLDGTDFKDFLIVGMDYYHPRPKFVDISISPLISRFYNRELVGDERFTSRMTPGFHSMISYHQLITDHLGISFGLGIGMFNNVLVLDHFDPWLGMDPHMAEVSFSNQLWTVDLPLVLDLWMAKEGKLRPYFQAGLVGSTRFFETSSSRATRSLTGDQAEGVVSDPGWYETLNRFNLRGLAGAGILLNVKNAWFIDVGVKYDQGVTGLDHRSDILFEYSRYTGQNNPLWAEPDHLTLLQAFRVHLGIVFMLNE